MTKESAAGSSKKDADLKAVQVVRDALEEFDNEKREQIIRWARESLGLPAGSPSAAVAATAPGTPAAPRPPAPPGSPKDIATFVKEKDPQTDMHLAATIAYFYRFVAPPTEQKEEIDAESLKEACRLAGLPGKLTAPLTTLNNAHGKGLLDRGSARGKFVVNSVGENLVGMILPGGTSQPPRGRRRKAGRQRAKVSVRKPK